MPIIQNIHHSIGRYGVITPIVILDTEVPISMAGEKVVASSNTIIVLEPGMYENMGIGVGSKVELIPMESTNLTINKINYNLKLTDDSTPLTKDAIKLIPINCLSCNNYISEYAGQYICNNVACPASVYQKCIHFIRSVGIYLHGSYLNILTLLIARKLIKTPLDIFLTTDHEVLETLDNISDKHLNLYKALISDVVGKISMNQLITGLDILPYENTEDVRTFVVEMISKYQSTEYEPFNILSLIRIVEDALQRFNIYTGNGYVDMPDTWDNKDLTIEDKTFKVSRGDITTQLNKLDEKDYNTLCDMFCNIGLARISYLMSYISNSDNKEMLISMHKLGILKQ